MPFQDIEEVSTSDVPHAPSRLERALRRIFVEDWSLKLLALAITLALWLAVAGQNKPVTTRASVLLNFIRPDSFEISNDPPKSVDVLLTASRHKFDRLSLLDLVATVDLSDQRAGERVLRLSDRAQMELPDGVKIASFQPSAIAVRLDPVVERQLEIDPKIEGQPADGYEVYSVHPSKGSVAVRGPSGHVNSLQKAPTETISAAGRKESFTAANIAIDIADPKIDLLDPVVSVVVEIGERRTDKTFAAVPVSGPNGVEVQPRTTTITLFGPPGLLEQLRSQDIRIVLDGTDHSLEPRLHLPQEFLGKISLKSLKPSQFSLLK